MFLLIIIVLPYVFVYIKHKCDKKNVYTLIPFSSLKQIFIIEKRKISMLQRRIVKIMKLKVLLY